MVPFLIYETFLTIWRTWFQACSSPFNDLYKWFLKISQYLREIILGTKWDMYALLSFDLKPSQQIKEQGRNSYFWYNLGVLFSLNEHFRVISLDYIRELNFHQYSHYWGTFFSTYMHILDSILRSIPMGKDLLLCSF